MNNKGLVWLKYLNEIYITISRVMLKGEIFKFYIRFKDLVFIGVDLGIYMFSRFFLKF